MATLSICICTYKRPQRLARLLASVIPQVCGVAAREIVVVNDGSDDEAYAAVMAGFAGKVNDHCLKTNVGIAEARNVAARQARFEYLVYVDDDCVVPSWWLNWLDARLDSEPELDVVAGVTEPLWPAKRTLAARMQGHFGFHPNPSRAEGQLLFPTANVAIRRQTLLTNGLFGFPGHFHGAGEDTELSVRLHAKGARMALDHNWSVQHDVGEPLLKLCQRYWRYGHANVSMLNLTMAPISYLGLRHARRGRELLYLKAMYRAAFSQSAGFDGNWLERRIAALMACLVWLSLGDGYAVAARKLREKPSFVPTLPTQA